MEQSRSLHQWLTSKQRSQVDGRAVAQQVVSVPPARVRLDVDSPFLGAQVEGFQGAVFAEELDTVSIGVAAIVPCSWLALRVFVCEAGAQCFNHRL